MTSALGRKVNTITDNEDLVLRQELIYKYGEMPPGLSYTGLICPKCGGGNSRERSFNISRIADDGSIRWMCHRASCDFKGTSSATGHSLRKGKGQEADGFGGGQSAAKIVRTVAERVGKLVDLPDEVKDQLAKRYFLSEPTISDCGLKWSTSASPHGSGRVFIPLRSSILASNGCVLRAIDGKQQPKSITFREPYAKTTLGWWFGGAYEDFLFIVEDAFSAIRCFQAGFSAVSLSGTHISDERIEEIVEARNHLHFRPLLALDADAFPASIKKMRRLRTKLPGINVIKLDKDIKNLTPLESNTFFNGWKIPKGCTQPDNLVKCE